MVKIEREEIESRFHHIHAWSYLNQSSHHFLWDQKTLQWKNHLLPFCVNALLMVRSLACLWPESGMLARWHHSRTDQKHLFTFLMNRLYVTNVPGLQRHEGNCGERRGQKTYCQNMQRVQVQQKEPSAAAILPVYITGDTTCQGCRLVPANKLRNQEENNEKTLPMLDHQYSGG